MKSVSWINAEEVEERLDALTCTALMEKVIRDQEEGSVHQYLRNALVMPNGNVMASMPAYFEEGYFGMKALSVYPHNSKDGYPSHQGAVLVFDETHGELRGMVDAASITKIRTGACSAAASKVLARKESSVLALIGCGEQAWSHLYALVPVFPLEEVRVFDLSEKKAQDFAKKAQEETGIGVISCKSVEEAVNNADIICTLTPGTPAGYLKKEWIKEGAHINAVGACSAGLRELESELVCASSFYCDNVESLIHEAGDYLYPYHEGKIDESFVVGTIGEVLTRKKDGRTSPAEITVFESLGMAVEDLAAAAYLLKKE